LNDENVHYLVEKLENLDVNNIDVDTVNDVVLNCNSIIKNAADMIVEFKPKKVLGRKNVNLILIKIVI
jgi:hypothetical protein